MKKNYSFPFLALLVWFTACRTEQKVTYYPDKQFGELFRDVQMQSVFADSKTFPDCIPIENPETILSLYQTEKRSQGFNLQRFVQAHFTLPASADTLYRSDTSATMESHLVQQWDNLTRQPDQVASHSSLIGLPKPYVVPGGRFREIYYWDSYFTMLGLAASNRFDLIENMLDNFAYLITTHGHIPNGNRSYYLSRSQPPFFSSMVMLFAKAKGMDKAIKYLPQLEMEYTFWMKGRGQLTDIKAANQRVVLLDSGIVMNRYWDNLNTPRVESYREDVLLGKNLSPDNQQDLYRNIRAACESGWDFSSRWFDDGHTLSTIVTTQIIPVDLNVLMYHLEATLAEMYAYNKKQPQAQRFQRNADARKKALLHYCWNEEKGFFFDYNWQRKKQTEAYSLAAAYPLCYGLATPAQAQQVAAVLEKRFLNDGGLVTTLQQTTQQWDAPNGWPPLQWLTIKGLERYGQDTLAATIKTRWLHLNERVFKGTGKMMEKYNVVDLHLGAGGGEYPLQDGFGWTNGVALSLIRENKK